jgi:hypothetical protein
MRLRARVSPLHDSELRCASLWRDASMLMAHGYTEHRVMARGVMPSWLQSAWRHAVMATERVALCRHGYRAHGVMASWPWRYAVMDRWVHGVTAGVMGSGIDRDVRFNCRCAWQSRACMRSDLSIRLPSAVVRQQRVTPCGSVARYRGGRRAPSRVCAVRAPVFNRTVGVSGLGFSVDDDDGARGARCGDEWLMTRTMTRAEMTGRNRLFRSRRRW